VLQVKCNEKLKLGSVAIKRRHKELTAKLS